MSCLLLILAWLELIYSGLSNNANTAMMNVIVFIGTIIYFRLDDIHSSILDLLKEVKKHDS